MQLSKTEFEQMRWEDFQKHPWGDDDAELVIAVYEERANSLPTSLLHLTDIFFKWQEEIVQGILSERLSVEPQQNLPELSASEKQMLDMPSIKPDTEKNLQDKLDVLRMARKTVLSKEVEKSEEVKEKVEELVIKEEDTIIPDTNEITHTKVEVKKKKRK